MAENQLHSKASQIWSMLDEMYKSNPTEYKKFIDKNIKEGQEYRKPPKPHMCIRTKLVHKAGNTNFFLNICSWNRIPGPKTTEDSIPVQGSEMFTLKDEKGKSYRVLNVAFNPSVLDQYGKTCKNEEEADSLIQLAFAYTEDYYKVKVHRDYSVCTEFDIKGSVEEMIQAFKQRSKATDDEMDKDMAELEKSFGPIAEEAKRGNLLSQVNVFKETKDDMVSTDVQPTITIPGITDDQAKKDNRTPLVKEIVNPLSQPSYNISSTSEEGKKFICVKVKLPGIKSVAECDLEITEDEFIFSASNKYSLQFALPEPVDEEESSAQFDTTIQQLTVKMASLTPLSR